MIAGGWGWGTKVASIDEEVNIEFFPNMLLVHDFAVLVMHFNNFFVISGLDRKHIQPKSEKYEFGRNSWSIISDIQQPVWNSCGAVLGNKIYIFGGAKLTNGNT